MSDKIDHLESLAALARNTRAVAPRPAPPAVLRILAARRRAERASRRLLAIIVLVCVAPIVIVVVTWALLPGAALTIPFMAVVVALAFVAAIGGIGLVA